MDLESLRAFLGWCTLINLLLIVWWWLWIALGGGSVIDAAKLIGARAVQPKKSLHKMRGLLKVRRDIPLLIAVPTTAGTGSETTVAAVVRLSRNSRSRPAR